jgi:chromosome segregation ATPase
MKKILFLALSLFVLVSCKESVNTQETAELNQRIDSLARVNVQKDNEINDMLETLNSVEDGFRAINEAQGRVTLERRGEGANASERIKENMQFIQSTMEQNRALIKKLRQQLSKSTVKADALQKALDNLQRELEQKTERIAQLQAELEAKDIHIQELDQRVTELNTDVTNLTEENVHHQQTISNQDRELHSAWFVFGTKKELKEQRILEGGRVLQSNFNKDYFTKIDIRVQKEIKLYSKSAEIKTAHPAGSYVLERDADKQYVLRITDPQKFWSTSKYLVILVK